MQLDQEGEIDNILNLKTRVPVKWQEQWERNMQIRKHSITSKVLQQNDYNISDKLELKLIKQLKQKYGSKIVKKHSQSQDLRLI